MNIRTENVLATFLFYTMTLGWVNLANAQMKLEVGEKVKVATFFGWADGEVLGKQGKGWGVRYKDVHKEQSGLFHRNQIRKLCEVDALDWARSWASANGNFKIDAALKEFNDLEVTLTKLDLDEVKVKIDRLSTKDVTYLNKLKKNRETAANRGEIPAIVPPLPELTEFDSDSAEPPGINVGEAGKLMSPLGPMPDFLGTFAQEGVGFPKIRTGQEPVAVIPVGGPDQLVLVTARENSFFSGDYPFQAQGYWVSLKQKKVVNTFAVSPDAYPVDYDPRHKLLLTVRRSDGAIRAQVPVPQGLDSSEAYTDLGEYVLWRLKPGDSKVEPLIRWHAGAESFPDAPVAKIINDTTVLFKIGNHVYRALDVETKRIKYSFKTSSRSHDTGMELTLDRKNLIVPDGERIQVINAETGETRFTVQIPHDWAFGANVNRSGTKLAAITGRSLYVWDLNSSEAQPAAYQAPLIGSPFFSRLQWVDDDNILINGFARKVLYRLSLKLPVWSYEIDIHETKIISNDPLISCVIDGFIFYLADNSSIFGGTMAVGAVKLPGPSVENLAEMASGGNADSFYVLKPGVAVGISIDSVTDPDQVTQWLEEKIEEAGWVYDQGSEIQIHAEMGVAPSREETYRQFGDFRGDNTISVTVTPHFASIKIKDGNRVLWQTGVSTGAPMFARTDDLQQTIKEGEVPQLEFFNRVKFEPLVLDPEYSYGFGVSKLGLEGIEVVTTSPPGRVDDPFSEAEKMQKERDNLQPPTEKPGTNAPGRADPGSTPGGLPPGSFPPGLMPPGGANPGGTKSGGVTPGGTKSGR
jgi:hypothetical protein